jgi:penicillin amidase
MLRVLALHLCLFLFVFAPAGAQAAGWSTLDVNGEEVRTYRDDFSRPHIFAKTNRGLFTAYGYALAEDRLWQLEVNRRVARGRLAEIFGAGTPVLSDRFVRTTGYTDAELDAQFAALDAADRAIYEAYVAGINRFLAFAAANPPARLPFEFLALGYFPAPFTTTDLAAFAAFMTRRFGEIGGNELANKALLDALVARHGPSAGFAMFNDVRWLVDRDSPATIHDSEDGEHGQHGQQSPHESQAAPLQYRKESDEDNVRRHWESIGVPSKLGSYGWVVSRRKSAEGYAMLYGGPQMGFAAPEIVHEVQLKSDEGFNAAGMSVAGMPFVLIGRNEHIAWTFTTGLANDNVDVYVESLCADGVSHLFQGACRPFEVREEHINVRGAAPVTLRVLRSVHGPVVGSSGAFVFTQKRAHWGSELASVTRVGGMDRARNLREFEREVLEVSVAFNVFYADQRGNIAYWFAGRNPVRAAGFDPRLPLPGDGSAEWTGAYLPVPSSINPSQGWLASWNNRPTRDYPGNEASFGTINRANDLFRRLEQERISLDDMRDIPKDIARVKGTLGREAPFLMPYLRRALNAVPPTHPGAHAAREVLRAWDGSAFADAVRSTTLEPGEIIFSAWLMRALENTFGDELGPNLLSNASSNMLLHVLDDALGDGSSVPPTRDYFNGVSPHAVLSKSFDEALAALAAAQGPNPSAWSAPRGSIAFSHVLLGTVASIPASNRSTYGQIVQLKRPKLESENIFTLGQSGRIGLGAGGAPIFDAHFFDQNTLYRNFEYKPMPLYMDTQLQQ